MQLHRVPPLTVRQRFEQELSELLEQSIHLPGGAEPDPAIEQRLRKYHFETLYIPDIREDQLPKSIKRPNLRRYIDRTHVERIPLSPGWVSVETIDLKGSRKAFSPQMLRNDKLMNTLGIVGCHDGSFASRFGRAFCGHSPALYSIVDTLLPAIARALDLDPYQVSLPSLEERHFIAAWFNDQRTIHSRSLPDLNKELDPDKEGSNVWEWTRNRYNNDSRLIVSGREEDGMMAVSSGCETIPDKHSGFRVLVRHNISLS